MKKIVALISLVFFLSGCSAIISTQGSNDKKTITEAYNYIVDDIWNKGLCDIGYYISTGNDSTGETMDIVFTVQLFERAYSEKSKYDTDINGLKGDKYNTLKQYWAKMSSEIDKLHEQLQTNPPVANDSQSEFDTGLFSQYMDAFLDECNNVD